AIAPAMASPRWSTSTATTTPTAEAKAEVRTNPLAVRGRLASSTEAIPVSTADHPKRALLIVYCPLGFPLLRRDRKSVVSDPETTGGGAAACSASASTF